MEALSHAAHDRGLHHIQYTYTSRVPGRKAIGRFRGWGTVSRPGMRSQL